MARNVGVVKCWGLAFCLLIYGSITLCSSVAALEINSETDSYPLTASMSWYQDHTRSLTIDTLINSDTAIKFTPHRQQAFNQGFIDTPVWFHIPLNQKSNNQYPPSNRLPWLLTIAYPLLDVIDIYTVRANGSFSQTTLGDSQPFNQRPVKHQYFIAPLLIGENEPLDIYIRVETESYLRMPLSLVKPNLMVEQLAKSNTIYGIYFGIMAAMIFYNLLIFFAYRDSSYLLYIMYIGCFALLQGAISGHSYTYLWPNSPQTAQLSIPVLITLSCFFAIKFCSNFLSLSKNSPVFDQMLNLLSAIALLILAITFIAPYSMAIQSAMLLAILTITAIIFSASINFIRGHKIARFFLLAWICVLPGPLIHAFTAIDWLPMNFFTQNAGLAGSILEALLLSLALTDRENYLSKENQKIAKISRSQMQMINSELSETLSKLEKSNRLKNQFLGTISHELRTPMNGVEGSLDLIKTDNLTKKQQHYIETAKQSAHQMTTLVDSILRFSEIQSGELELRRERFELRKVLNPIAIEFRQLCLSKNLNFCWHIDKSVPTTTEGDSDQLLLILRQLVDNAIKFTQQGQVSINIGAGWDEYRHQQMLFFSVIDSGEGIPPEQLDTIFNAFQQLNGDYNRSYRGLGIGLAICNQLAKIMGGKLSVESTPGVGTEFIFTLPLYSCTAPTDEDQTEEQEQLSEQKTILVAEDNPVNQMVLKGMLQRLDCLIVTANNGEEVCQILDAQPVDLIMMDCQMPLVDGFEATRKIRESSSAYSNVPIIAVTANAMTGDSARCINAGMNDYIKKPIKQEVIERKVKRWLQNGKLAAV